MAITEASRMAARIRKAATPEVRQQELENATVLASRAVEMPLLSKDTIAAGTLVFQFADLSFLLVGPEKVEVPATSAKAAAAYKAVRGELRPLTQDQVDKIHKAHRLRSDISEGILNRITALETDPTALTEDNLRHLTANLGQLWDNLFAEKPLLKVRQEVAGEN